MKTLNYLAFASLAALGMKLRSVGHGERPIGVSAARMTTSASL